MHGTVHVVVNSGYHGHFEVVSCENLGRLVDENVSLFVILSDVSLHFVEVGARGPTVNVDDRQEQVFCWYHHFLEFLLQMLGAP